MLLNNNEKLYYEELKTFLIDKIQNNIKIIAIIDACSSEDCFKLKYNYFDYNFYKYRFKNCDIKIIYSCLKNQFAIEYYDPTTELNFGLFTFYLYNVLRIDPNISWNNLVYFINYYILKKNKIKQVSNLYFNKSNTHEIVNI